MIKTNKRKLATGRKGHKSKVTLYGRESENKVKEQKERKSN